MSSLRSCVAVVRDHVITRRIQRPRSAWFKSQRHRGLNTPWGTKHFMYALHVASPNSTVRVTIPRYFVSSYPFFAFIRTGQKGGGGGGSFVFGCPAVQSKWKATRLIGELSCIVMIFGTFMWSLHELTGPPLLNLHTKPNAIELFLILTSTQMQAGKTSDRHKQRRKQRCSGVDRSFRIRWQVQSPGIAWTACGAPTSIALFLEMRPKKGEGVGRGREGG